MTTGSPPLRLAIIGTVSRFIGAGVGVARLVAVSRVKVVDMVPLMPQRAVRGKGGRTFHPGSGGCNALRRVRFDIVACSLDMLDLASVEQRVRPWSRTSNR